MPKHSKQMHPAVRTFAWVIVALIVATLAMVAGMTVLGVTPGHAHAATNTFVVAPHTGGAR